MLLRGERRRARCRLQRVSPWRPASARARASRTRRRLPGKARRAGQSSARPNEQRPMVALVATRRCVAVPGSRPAFALARARKASMCSWLRGSESSVAASVRERRDCSWFVARRSKRATGRLHNLRQRVRRHQPSEAPDPASCLQIEGDPTIAIRALSARRDKRRRCHDHGCSELAHGRVAGPPSGRLPRQTGVSAFVQGVWWVVGARRGPAA